MMTRTILEYAVTDKFILLFLTARGMGRYKGDHKTINRNRYDPEIVGVFQDDLGIPDSITCTSAEFNLDEEGEFHSSKNHPSFHSKVMWFDWLDDQSPKRQHREEKPALIRFDEYQMFHTHGRLREVRIDRWEFKWFTHGKLYRESGPFSIIGEPVHIIITKDNQIKTTSPIKAQFGWNHPGGGNIPGTTVTNAIKDNGIQANLFDPGKGVFQNEMEEMIFYSSI